jgi:hypothetical protein
MSVTIVGYLCSEDRGRVVRGDRGHRALLHSQGQVVAFGIAATGSGELARPSMPPAPK